MRIAAGGISIECTTFSPVLADDADFSILRGADLLVRYEFTPAATLVPLLHAWAVPGGPVRPAVYEAIKTEFLAALREQGPFDGVYLDMHGAMYVDDQEDAEGDWTAAVRALVGPDCLISASYDLHGNVSQRVMDNVDILTAYRTAPHEDTLATRERAVALLVDCIKNGVRPYKSFIPIPVMLTGERTMTTIEPGRSVYAQIPSVIHDYGLLDASLLVGFAWADEPRVHACALAFGTDEATARQAAEQLAQAYWDARHDFQFGMTTGTIDECIQIALAATENGVFLSDSGDNVTAGGPGDATIMLEKLLAAPVPGAVYASILDAAAVAACAEAGTGVTVEIAVGGKLDTRHGGPLTLRGTVLTLAEPEPDNRHVVLLVNQVQVIITERRTAFTTIGQFTALHIVPLDHKIICVKLGYLFPELRQIAAQASMALSPGVVNAVIEDLPFERIRRPMYPLDPSMEWQP